MKKSKTKVQPDIRIIVAGGTAKGKSTVLQIIAEAMVKAGLTTEIRNNPGDYHSPIVVEEFQDQRVMSVKGKKPVIVIEERQTYRSVMGEHPNKIYGVEE